MVAAMRMGELTVLMAKGRVIGLQSKWASWLHGSEQAHTEEDYHAREWAASLCRFAELVTHGDKLCQGEE